MNELVTLTGRFKSIARQQTLARSLEYDYGHLANLKSLFKEIEF